MSLGYDVIRVYGMTVQYWCVEMCVGSLCLEVLLVTVEDRVCLKHF